MNCSEAREALLVAEPSELVTAALTAPDDSDGSGGALAGHLAVCDACRRLAGLMAADLNGLSVGLRARARRRTMLLTALPVAAVLIATVTVVARRSSHPTPALPSRAERAASVVSVDVGVGQRAAVIKTADPKTTLVWISSGTN